MKMDLIIAGVGGQGSILAARIIAGAAMKLANQDSRPFRVRVGETFGAAMRGGAVSSHVRFGDVYAPLINKGEADLIIALEPLEGLRVGVEYLSPEGTAILNNTPFPPMDVQIGKVRYPALEEIVSSLRELGKKVVVINGTELAQKAGHPRTMSVVMLGAALAGGFLPLGEDLLVETLRERVPGHTVAANLRALALGQEAFLAAD